MAGAVHQMKADHAGARGFLHTLGGAWGLVDAPVAFAPDEHGWDVVRYACNQYRCWSRPNYYRGSGYYGYGYGSYYGYGYPAYYGYYALRSEPGFYRRPYYGYYRGY